MPNQPRLQSIASFAQHTRRIIALLLIVITLCIPGRTLAAPWRAGLARVDITPTEPVPMGGYAGRQVVFEKVLSPLHAKALAIEDEQGNQGLIVSCDILGFQKWFTQPLVKRLMQRTGLSRERIILSSSHTHTGPLLGYDSRYPFDQAIKQRIERYVAKLCDDIIDISLKALANLRPAELSRHIGSVDFPMNRRQPNAAGRINLGANPDGPVDRSVPVLRITSPDGRVLGVVFGASCHPTTLGAQHAICADYPGYAQAHIEKALPGAQAIFLQGCAGDTGPQPNGSPDLARKHGEALGAEVLARIGEAGRTIGGPLRATFEQVDTPLLALDGPDGATGWPYADFIARSLRQRLAAGKDIPTHYPCPVATWQFGAGANEDDANDANDANDNDDNEDNSLTLVTLSGEVVVDYIALIQAALGPDRLWIASYAHENFGYLPSARVLKEGGYETRGLIYAADQVGMDGAYGIFAPEAERAIVEAVRQQAIRVGRRGVE